MRKQVEEALAEDEQSSLKPGLTLNLDSRPRLVP
jgi:hypothetical protein